ncbi:Sugar efflux transporter for intercellular exchange [Phytophthora infestans]|uniref:Sugar efflux transporter for intercellular exchange n=2 Tax=Phytophthora infestans TaxID=4787 RepID=A0A8S9V1U6_PHYIN|nr:Sugar efflux transporter for intercellular exchange [Phytophthora infestans]KAF4149819.1 Sugar efflux transporter for intercellular exchange [Phytophthora infestans]
MALAILPEVTPQLKDMSVHATAVIVAKVMTFLSTLMMRVSLLPDFRRMHKNRRTGDMSVMPCLLLFVNSYAVMFYAIAIDDMEYQVVTPSRSHVSPRDSHQALTKDLCCFTKARCLFTSKSAPTTSLSQAFQVASHC